MERRPAGRFLMMALLLGLAATAPAAAERLVTAAIDDSHVVALEGNTRPEAVPANDRGAVPAGLRLDHMQLLLKRSPAREAAAASFADALQDPASPDYHHWLTAEQYGARFGADAADLAAIQGWLQRHGFTVEGVAPSRMVIDFSGTAGEIAAAFHTEIHALDVAGVRHIANMSDPEIPEALAPAVAGITSLHDFRAHNKHRAARPGFTGSGCNGPCWAMAPGDLQTIYGMTSLYKSGITGKGQTIVVVEDTDLYTNADFTDFRKTFGLTAYPTGNTLVVTHPAPAKGTNNCADPKVNANGDDVEAALDVEWSSAAAPGATIELAACNNTKTSDGVFLAMQNLINAKSPPPIISVSYGNCEADNGASYNAAFETLFQQAATEGVSVFVATGDYGPTDCTYGVNFTTYGIGVSAWAATQYAAAVGGTDFSDTSSGTNNTYWNKTSSAATHWASAKSYVPEMAWNDSCGSVLLAQYVDGISATYGKNGFCNNADGNPSQFPMGGGEGGPSACFTGKPAIANVVGGTCKGLAKPSWQAGAFGNPADKVRDIPDVSLFAADGVWSHYYLLCFSDPSNGGGPCTANPGNWPPGGGGTSYATPIVAGMQALVNQKMAGKRQGNPAPIYYKLAAKEYGTSGSAACNASKGNAIGSGCVFNDVTLNNDTQPCKKPYDCYDPSGTYGVLSTSDTSPAIAYNSKPGWDFPTGIGTVNAANLVAKWSSVAP